MRTLSRSRTFDFFDRTWSNTPAVTCWVYCFSSVRAAWTAAIGKAIARRDLTFSLPSVRSASPTCADRHQLTGSLCAHWAISLKMGSKHLLRRKSHLVRCTNVSEDSSPCPLHDSMSTEPKYLVQWVWVCTTTGAPRPASPALGPVRTHALTVAHTVALTPYSSEKICRAEQGDVAKALNRCTTRSSARMRNLRRQAHDMRQRGQKWD